MTIAAHDVDVAARAFWAQPWAVREEGFTRLRREDPISWHRPAESDLLRYFQVSPPSVHEMIKTLELNGLIERTPGQARSIRLLVLPEHLPALR